MTGNESLGPLTQLDALIGQNVRRYREALGITQLALAARLRSEGWAIIDTAMPKIEAGKRALRVNQLALVARVLGRNVADFFGEEDLADVRSALERHERSRTQLITAAQSFLQTQDSLSVLILMDSGDRTTIDAAMAYGEAHELVEESIEKLVKSVEESHNADADSE